jgi:GntR family transcriptional regulator/MocR family aminotransferase
MDRQSPTLLQAVVAEFMQQGHFGAHIRRMRQVYRDQRDALVAILTRRAPERLDVRAPDQGMHLVAYLNNGVSDSEIEAAASSAGVVVSRFYKAAPSRSGLMLGFSGFPPSVIVPAAARLAKLVTAARTVV